MDEFYNINILENALSVPTIPLPTKSTPEQKLSITQNFINALTSTQWQDIYAYNEPDTNSKYSREFNSGMREKMVESMKTDPAIDSIAHEIVQGEIVQGLIKSDSLEDRKYQVKEFLISYHTEQNELNLPSFNSIRLLKVAYFTIISLFTKVFSDGIWVNYAQFEEILRGVNEKPIVYCPNHTSHVDYIIIHLILIRFMIDVPFVIAGDNLNLAFFGYILKNLGAVFIKRNFNNERYTGKNYFNLIKFIIDNNLSLEVFIEGARSRNGKVMGAKYGILKSVIGAVEQQNEQGNGAVIQPVSIRYEKVYESDGYIHELMGYDKKPESFTRIIYNGVRSLFGNTKRQNSGKIFVTLGSRINVDSKNKDSHDLAWLGYNILKEINQVSYYTDISIICFAIQLHNYFTQNDTFEISELYQILKFLIPEIKSHDFKVNSCSNNSTNLQKWSSLLEDEQKLAEVIKYNITKFLKDVQVSENDSKIVVKSSIELLYYKNSILHLFIDKVIVSFILVNCTTSLSRVPYFFNMITELLQREFLFQESSYGKVLQELIDDDVITANLELINESYLKRFSILLIPYLESYNLIISQLNTEISNTKTIEFKKLIKLIHKSLSSESGKQFNNESFNKQTLLNFIYELQDLEMIKIHKHKKGENFITIKDTSKLSRLHKFVCGRYFDVVHVDRIKSKL